MVGAAAIDRADLERRAERPLGVEVARAHLRRATRHPNCPARHRVRLDGRISPLCRRGAMRRRATARPPHLKVGLNDGPERGLKYSTETEQNAAISGTAMRRSDAISSAIFRPAETTSSTAVLNKLGVSRRIVSSSGSLFRQRRRRFACKGSSPEPHQIFPGPCIDRPSPEWQPSTGA